MPVGSRNKGQDGVSIRAELCSVGWRARRLSRKASQVKAHLRVVLEMERCSQFPPCRALAASHHVENREPKVPACGIAVHLHASDRLCIHERARDEACAPEEDVEVHGALKCCSQLSKDLVALLAIRGDQRPCPPRPEPI